MSFKSNLNLISIFYIIYASNVFASSEIEESTYLHLSSFSRINDEQQKQALNRLMDINAACSEIEKYVPKQSLCLFLGRSVAWFAEMMHERQRLNLNFKTSCDWKTIHFSGGSAIEDLDSNLYTPLQFEGYKSYLESEHNITADSLLGYPGGIVLIDFIMMGRTMTHFVQLLNDLVADKNQNLKISTIDISFTSNYRSDFDHRDLNPVPRQIIVPERTMNPLIHAKGLNDIGKDNCLVCPLKPNQWILWKEVLQAFVPTEKAMRMKKSISYFLKHYGEDISLKI